MNINLLPELNNIILHNLNKGDLYSICVTNKYFLNLCKSDKILHNRFIDAIQLNNTYLDSLKNRSLVLSGINPYNKRKIILYRSKVYYDLLDLYDLEISESLDELKKL